MPAVPVVRDGDFVGAVAPTEHQASLAVAALRQATALDADDPTVRVQGSTPAMGAAYLDRNLKECDAAAVMLEAVQTDRSLVRRFASVSAPALDTLATTVESIDDARAPQTKAQALNTCSFALKNLPDSLRAVGLVGVAKGFDAAAKRTTVAGIRSSFRQST